MRKPHAGRETAGGGTCCCTCYRGVSEAARQLVVLPRVLQGGEVLREPCLSPSQIESYWSARTNGSRSEAAA